MSHIDVEHYANVLCKLNLTKDQLLDIYDEYQDLYDPGGSGLHGNELIEEALRNLKYIK